VLRKLCQRSVTDVCICASWVDRVTASHFLVPFSLSFTVHYSVYNFACLLSLLFVLHGFMEAHLDAEVVLAKSVLAMD
jgi:hypothetical protein